MRSSRAFFLLILLIAVAAIAWYFTSHSAPPNRITVYYTKPDGASEIPWTISVRPQQNGENAAQRQQYLVLYAASQAVAGPAPQVAALRFPAGTHVVAASVDGTTANVDLSADIAGGQRGAMNEGGEFKALVWTLTSLPGVDAVQVTVAGKKIATLPGGSFELDEPLRRSDW